MAEVTLHLVAAPGILDTDRLAALGLTLRAQLSLEVRRARVIANYASTDTHPHILPSTTVGRVVMQTASGPQFPVVVGIPPQVLRAPLQSLRLPPPPVLLLAPRGAAPADALDFGV